MVDRADRASLHLVEEARRGPRPRGAHWRLDGAEGDADRDIRHRVHLGLNALVLELTLGVEDLAVVLEQQLTVSPELIRLVVRRAICQVEVARRNRYGTHGIDRR